MARAALGLSLHQLAALSHVSEKTIRRTEAAIGIPPVSRETMVRLRKVFEDNGCSFDRDQSLDWVLVKVDRGAAGLMRQNFPDGDDQPDAGE
ncbi:helix-turn-helix domain-containing protein [Methylorubrum extorquens]|uniref:helix-turn-helix domain-containing protein n=1 Tax=Methylorubrum extorquens TaxID=408 RepID=UPI00209FEC35|nr:helix-turn-helix transcriptional regulator [Methylorubrum extorquens]MCP1540021.1 transcriptional regulator with XRE-family HTH domain [Methylorubrum extorquens]